MVGKPSWRRVGWATAVGAVPEVVGGGGCWLRSAGVLGAAVGDQGGREVVVVGTEMGGAGVGLILDGSTMCCEAAVYCVLWLGATV